MGAAGQGLPRAVGPAAGAGAGPCKRLNGLGARAQGKVLAPQRAARMYDRIETALLRKAAGVRGEEWQRGMYYPTRWDGNFAAFMTLEKLFHYPVVHCRFHLAQIAR